MYIDSHCHLDFPELQSQLPAVLARMREQRVTHALCINVELPKFAEVVNLAQTHTHLYASVGVHPERADTPEPSVEQLCEWAAQPKVVAIGETGLDYHWHRDASAVEWQRERFRVHIRAARACAKPLIIHTREAGDDTLRILREERADRASGGPAGVIHCFTETWSFAEAAMELGFYVSFSGIVTFKNAKDLKEVAARLPLDRLLIETDSPYLAPAPHRGKTNEPAFVALVAAEIARLRGVEVEEIAAASTANFFRLFNIDPL